MRYASSGLFVPGTCHHRETERTPPGASRSKKIPHASVVYSEFSVRANAPAAEAAQVSISEIWMRSYRFAVRAR